MTLPRCSRVASPSGVPSDAAACARPGTGRDKPGAEVAAARER